ncbi:MAG TPA: Gfo/Idh/MocA family oxidoreductase [Burkholderiaceae bacterium]|nr:Gfo/Idh/MocA family oxidoreductase [Burkholderiaceae bacterium]HQZ07253.1 Gfo/Idh/MocA family oxidoreductase [Burkholderiaceae bacterium]
MKKVVWGVLSTARIGREKVIPAMQAASLCDMHAIASRSLARAQHTAGALGIPVAYGSYEELFADPAIEAIYNPLPNDQHVALTLQAARAGKHVLCEKPLALDADQAAQLREVATRVHIMEAFMVRFHPQWAHVRERVRCGDLGAVRSIQTWFSYFNKQADNIRNHVDQGGGALYDIGCYAVVTARYLFECEPQRVIALVDRDPQFGTDRTISALLDFGSGRRLVFTASTQSVPYQRVQVIGERKRIEVRIPFNATPGKGMEVLTDDGSALDGSGIRSETMAACDQYGLQGDAFARAIRTQTPLAWGVDDAVANMRVIDALFASEKSGAWVGV